MDTFVFHCLLGGNLMSVEKHQFRLIIISIILLMTTFASIFNWFQGLGGTGAHADKYDDLFTLYWTLGTIIGGAVYLYFLYLLTTSPEDNLEESMEIGELPVIRDSKKVAGAITIVVTLFLLILSESTFDSINFFEDPETTDDSFTIEVTGYQYYWIYEYPNGASINSATGESMKIPVNVSVIFEVTSGDVFHSFALPDHRIKIDAIPGRVNDGWILADDVGIFPIRCAELCGDEHAIMMSEVEVMSLEDFSNWYNSEENL